MAVTNGMLRIGFALCMLVCPACLTRDLVRPNSPQPIPIPNAKSAAITPPTVEPPRPVISYQPVARTVEPVLVMAPTPPPTLEVNSLPRTEELSSPPEREPPILPKAHPVEPPLLASLRLYMDRKPDESIRALQPYGQVNQELLIALMPVLARASEGDLAQASPQDVASLIEQLQTAATSLKSRAALRTDTVCFCKRVVKFGVFDPLSENHSFSPGEMAELYVEVRNVVGTAQANPEGIKGFTTRLNTEMILRDGNHKLVWREDCDKSEFSHSPRHDLDLHYRFCVPNVPAGNYTLWVRIVDQSTSRSVTRQVPIKVTTMPAPAM